MHEPPSCMGGRVVWISMRNKTTGYFREERLAIPNTWRKSDLLRYARTVHGGRYAVRIVSWLDDWVWLANPEAFEDFEQARPTKEWA